jgi:hypothetical protein
MTTTITSLEQLHAVEPDDTINVYGLNLDGQKINAQHVWLYNCISNQLTIESRFLIIDGGNYGFVNAAAAEHVELRNAEIQRLVIPSDSKEVFVSRCNLGAAQIGGTSDLHILESWVHRLVTGETRFIKVFSSYLAIALSRGQSPVIYAHNAAVSMTNWPLIDAGTDWRGYRLNVFRGRKHGENPVMWSSMLPDSEPALMVTAGCHQFVSLEDAVRHWTYRGNGMLELLEKAAEQLKQREEARDEFC